MTDEATTKRRSKNRGGPRSFWALLLALAIFLASFILGEKPRNNGGGDEDEGVKLVRFQLGSQDVPRFVDATVPEHSGTNALGTSPLVKREAEKSHLRGSPESGPVTLDGQLCDPDGRPLPGVEVRLVNAEGQGTWPHSTGDADIARGLSDAMGRFSFTFSSTRQRVQLLAHGSQRAPFVGPTLRPTPWRHHEMEAWKTGSRQRHVIEVTVSDETQATNATRVIVRPSSQVTPSLPFALDEELQFIPGDSVAMSFLVPSSGRIILPPLEKDRWEILVTAPGHRPVATTLESAQVNVGIALEAMEPEATMVAPKGADALLFLAETQSAHRFAVRLEPGGSTTLPLSWRRDKNSRWLIGGLGTSLAASTPLAQIQATLDTFATLRCLGPQSQGSLSFLRLRRRDAEEGDRDGAMHLGLDPLVTGGATYRISPGTWETTWLDREGTRCDGPALTLAAGEEREISPPPMTAQGTRLSITFRGLADAPLRGVAMILGAPTKGAAHSLDRVIAWSDKDGEITLTGLSPGPFTARVFGEGYRAKTLRWDIDTSHPQALTKTVVLEPAGASAELRVLDESGEALADINAIMVNGFGRLVRARSDARGQLLFLDLEAGPWVAFVDCGQIGVPLDSFDWLVDSSGCPVVLAESDRRVTRDWTLPRPQAARIALKVTAEGESHPPFVELSLHHGGHALAPGLWPRYELGEQRSGLIEIGSLFPGRYRAIARWGERVAVADVEVRPDSQEASILRIHFAKIVRTPPGDER